MGLVLERKGTNMKNALISLLMLSFISLPFFACSNNEESARKMLQEILSLAQIGKFDEADKKIQDIIRKYPETKIAAELRQQVLARAREIERDKAVSAAKQRPPEHQPAIIPYTPPRDIKPYTPPPPERSPAPREQMALLSHKDVTKGMSKLEVLKILGKPTLMEVFPAGGGSHAYNETWTYTGSDGDWVIWFWCGSGKSAVMKIERR